MPIAQLKRLRLLEWEGLAIYPVSGRASTLPFVLTPVEAPSRLTSSPAHTPFSGQNRKDLARATRMKTMPGRVQGTKGIYIMQGDSLWEQQAHLTLCPKAPD